MIDQPTPRSVFQRQSDNTAMVPVQGTVEDIPFNSVRARYILSSNPSDAGNWNQLAISGSRFDGFIEVPAGGWYIVEIKTIDNRNISAQTTVEKVGVGEVFIIAGQSNSTNCGMKKYTPTNDTVSAWTGSEWRHAYDPQPIVEGDPDICNTDPKYGGSTWSRLGDMLADTLGVPVGFMMTGFGGTNVRQWLPNCPDENYPLYLRLQKAIKDSSVYGARGILWHQGESDSLYKTTTSDYSERLKKVIDQSRIDAGWKIPWGVAIVSYLPQTTKEIESQIRAGQFKVISTTPSVFKGPDTDVFKDAYRGDGVHFNDAGLYQHAFEWLRILINSQLNTAQKLTLDLGMIESLASYWLDTGCEYCFNGE